MNIVELFQAQATAQPEAAAIVEPCRGGSRQLSFAELEWRSARQATLLQQAGLQRGDAVLVLLPLSAQLYITLGAIFRLGLVAMFVDPGAGRQHIARCCRLWPPRALIATPKAHLLRLLVPELRRIPLRFAPGRGVPGAYALSAADRLPPHQAPAAVAAEDPALLSFTSGSTGQPRAVVRSHGFLLAQHRALAPILGLRPGEVDLATMPIVTLCSLASGAASLIPDADMRRPGAVEPAPLVAQLLEHGATSTTASPALLGRIASYCQQRQLVLPALRRIFTGGAPVFPQLLAQLQQIAPQAEVVALYGSTEAEPIADLPVTAISLADQRAMASGAGLLAGLPVQTIQLRILPDRWGQPLGQLTPQQFEAACLGPGAAGEIVVSGEHVLKGYLHGSGDAETKFQVADQVWHRTGDAGYLDDQGRLWLLGRCAARIADARGTLYPFTVETALAGHAAIRRAALVGYQGRRVLTLELNAGSRLEMRWLRQRLAWAQIDEVRCLDQLPVDRRHNAKIDYPALRTLLARG